MPKRYSNDLRERVLSYYDNNHTQQATCERFEISRATLNKWLQIRRDTGSALYEPVKPLTRKRKLDASLLQSYIKEYPDAYLREIAEHFEVSIPAVWYACQRNKITRKKR